MSDLIDRKAAIEAIRSYCAGCDNYDGIRCRSCGIADAADKVEEVPTVDTEPVRRGKWLESPDRYWVKCSACEHGELNETPYCPHCGARMEG